MPAPTTKHAPSRQPFPVPWQGSAPDPLESLGLRLDYRTACHPWGSKMPAGDGQRIFTVIADGDWNRVTCKACLR